MRCGGTRTRVGESRTDARTRRSHPSPRAWVARGSGPGARHGSCDGLSSAQRTGVARAHDHRALPNQDGGTDPDVDAWYDDTDAQNENADKCAWMYGQTYPTANGAIANIRLGDRDFLVQQNWVNVRGGYCALAYP